MRWMRQILSTHLTRRSARKAQEHYEVLQYTASLEGPAGAFARVQCAQLGIGVNNLIEVERSRPYRAGRWAVVTR